MNDNKIFSRGILLSVLNYIAKHKLDSNFWPKIFKRNRTANKMERQTDEQVMKKTKGVFDEESYEEEKEIIIDKDLDQEDSAYFPVEESKPPHY